jgi:hypothetical protein
MYSEEVKDKILHLLKYKTIKEIADGKKLKMIVN